MMHYDWEIVSWRSLRFRIKKETKRCRELTAWLDGLSLDAGNDSDLNARKEVMKDLGDVESTWK